MTPDQIQTLVLYFLAFVGVLLFGYDAYERRKQAQTEQEQRRVQHDAELAFQQERFKHEKGVWDEQDRYLSRQASKFESLIDQIAARLKYDLVQDTDWLTQALRRSELHPYQDTIFGERSGHFHDEKSAIARAFSPRLVTHFSKILESYDRICLIIDSGTTLYPFFYAFGELALGQRARDPRPDWIDKMEIITNNIPGIVRLMQMDRPQRQDGIAALAVNCTLLAGQPLTEYAAVTGPDTMQSLQKALGERKTSTKCYTIGLVTGNWIRLRRTDPVCPIPMARGSGHLEFKQLVMHLSDEVYVVAPLGKIFVNAETVEINDLLNLREDAGKLKEAAYQEVDTSHAELGVNLDHVRLVTTIRTAPAQILRSHSALVADRFSIPCAPNVHQVVLGPNGTQRPILIPFNYDQTDENEQKLKEFPHAVTRRAEFFRRFQI